MGLVLPINGTRLLLKVHTWLGNCLHLWDPTDLQKTPDISVEKTGVDKIKVRHRPRLLTDNGPCYLSKDLKEYPDRNNICHTRGASYHPMTQGKIERYYRTMKNIIKLENYYLSGELEQAIVPFVEHYNNHRYHKSLNNVTPADMYYGRQIQIINQRKRVKKKTFKHRKFVNIRKNNHQIITSNAPLNF